MRLYLCLAFTLFSLLPLTAQERAGSIAPADLEQLQELEDTIALLSYAVVNDSTPEFRFAATRKLITTLKTALKVPNSFNYDFGQAQTISIQYPRDSSFRIFTWQLYVDVNEYRYYGAIQMNTPELQLHPLIDRSFNISDAETQELTANEWYGVLCYRLREFAGPDGPMYLLFGFDGLEFFHKRKIVDVLSFRDGKPVFGAPVFVENRANASPLVRHRIVLEYGAEASIKCNYDEILEAIVHDHLIMFGSDPQGKPNYVPDGSYVGYQLDETGRWIQVPKMFNEVLEEPPVPEPVLEDRKKSDVDIFGRKKGN